MPQGFYTAFKSYSLPGSNFGQDVSRRVFIIQINLKICTGLSWELYLGQIPPAAPKEP